MEYIVFDENLTKPDRLVLQSLASDLQTPNAADLHSRTATKASLNGHSQRGMCNHHTQVLPSHADKGMIAQANRKMR
jgi:hypothetical protein